MRGNDEIDKLIEFLVEIKAEMDSCESLRELGRVREVIEMTYADLQSKYYKED